MAAFAARLLYARNRRHASRSYENFRAKSLDSAHYLVIDFRLLQLYDIPGLNAVDLRRGNVVFGNNPGDGFGKGVEEFRGVWCPCKCRVNDRKYVFGNLQVAIEVIPSSQDLPSLRGHSH